MLKHVQFAYLSRPKADRTVYRAIAKHAPQRIVELAMGDGSRTLRMLQFAELYQSKTIHYAGIDLFESRPSGENGLSYKEAHRLLSSNDARSQLIPGDAYSALSRWANTLTRTDLLIIGSNDNDSLAQAWFYVPRMLHSDSIVLALQGQGDDEHFARLSPEEIEQRAEASQPARSAA